MSVIRITGLRGIQQDFRTIDRRLKNKVAIGALKSGAKLVQGTAKNSAPRRSGLLRRAIILRTSKRNRVRRNGVAGVYVGIDLKKAFYGRFIEHGTKYIKARKFLDGAFERQKNLAATTIVRAFSRGVEIAKRGTRIR